MRLPFYTAGGRRGQSHTSQAVVKMFAAARAASVRAAGAAWQQAVRSAPVAVPHAGFHSTPAALMKRKHKKFVDMAKGYRGRANSCYKIAINRVTKGLLHAYKGRKLKKRDMRKFAIIRTNAAARREGIKYNQLIHGMSEMNIGLSRKVLADMAATEPYSFRSVVKVVQQA